MKTKETNSSGLRSLLMIVLIFMTTALIAQTHPGADPFSTPIDGGILMALLAGGGLVSMLFKKKKDKDKE